MIDTFWKFYYLVFYTFFSKNKNRIIFYSASGCSFNQNSKHLFEYCINNSNLDCRYIINNDELRNELNNSIGNYFISNKGRHNIEIIMSSGVWVTSTGLPIKVPFFYIGRLCVNLWHGIPLKRVLYKDTSINMIKRLLFSSVYPKYDIVTSTSKVVSKVLVDSFRTKGCKVVVTGQAWNDAIFNESRRSELYALNSHINESSKLVLYAPTWRNSQQKSFSLNPFKTYSDERPSTTFFPFEDIDLAELQAYLEEENAFVFVRAHLLDSQSNERILSLPNVISFDQEKFPDVMDYINSFELLITDYSSIYFDFLHLERPIIFLPYDIEDYKKNPGFNFDYYEVTPGHKPKTFKAFKEAFTEGLSGNYDRGELKVAKESFHEFGDGNCKRIFDLIMNSRDS
ncbi:CDP-glycerol glycerophosphotransferase family protein [Vibrio alginolyticus]|nr:CDP-glycerol glycerophosphotransferase family protein [Vibrio alginolyticus]ELS4795773.1 CDP-glycerol glycerophosphotransferase family protein [Vibrio alginolyticus]MDW1807579.1 CDP-glycerol glycerophosphotransferase family protein [Vibrio sp. Vb2362]